MKFKKRSFRKKGRGYGKRPSSMRKGKKRIFRRYTNSRGGVRL